MFSSGLRRLDWHHASLFAVGLAWMLPFLQARHRPPIPSFYGEWWAFALGLLGASVLLRRAHWQPLTLPRVFWAPLALAMLLLLQLALGMIAYPQQALLGVVYLAYAALMAWLGFVLRTELGWPALARILAWSLFAGGTISALIALIQHFSCHGMWDGWVNASAGPTAAANLGQVNHFADYAALALGGLGYLGLAGRIPPAAALPLALLLLTGLGLSGSRSSWLYLGAFIFVAWAARAQLGRRAVFAALALPLVFGLAQAGIHLTGVAGTVAAVTPTERLFAGVSGIDARLALWRAAWQMFLGAPLLGVGFGQFAHALFERAGGEASLADTLFNHAHSLPLQLLAEFGALGIVAVGWSLGAWWLRSRREPWSAERAWLMALLSVLLIHSLLEYPLWYAYFLGIAAFLIGAGETHTMRLRVSGVTRAGFGLALVLATVSLLRLGADYTALDHAVVQSRRGSALPEVEAVMARTQRESLLAPYVEYVYAFGITLDREQIADKLALNTQVMRFAPSRETVYRQAELLALAGESDAARAMLRRAMMMYPGGVAEFAHSAQDPALRDIARANLNEYKQGVKP